MQVMINAVGPKEVTATDIIGDASMEIFNLDLHIATLEENATLVMTINLAKGRGYVPARSRTKQRIHQLRLSLLTQSLHL